MYYPMFKKDRHKVPILKKSEIDDITENFAEDFMPEIIQNPQPFKIEIFIEQYLKLTLDYQYLSNDGRYLGMMVFNDTTKVPVYIPEEERADYISACSGTVIADNSLLNNQEHRYRFTLGHECGHWIFHKDYYGYDKQQLSLFELEPYKRCREVNHNDISHYERKKDANQWMEWQADKFAGGILMPQKSVFCLLGHEQNYDDFSEDMVIRKVSSVFNVSEQAAYIRLFDLGIIKNYRGDSKYQQLSFV